ncbi:MAG: AIM24 family protein [Deltaproteobacteria bacterium]|nr:AIM24 family protein [Deltaproteobacteria bacterium]
MSHWYLSYDGNQMGPIETEQAIQQVQRNSNGYAWREGFASWVLMSQVPELQASAMTAMNPPPFGDRSQADEIDYKILGSEMQFVEIELDPGESAVAEAGAMMYKDGTVQMETIFGDGSVSSMSGTFMDKLMGAGKRLLTGESLFMTVFTHTGSGKAHVAFGAPYPGNIKIALFGGEGFFFAVLQGPGKIWLQSLPFSRLAGRILRAAPQHGGSSEEGSVLGTLGNLIGGDR